MVLTKKNTIVIDIEANGLQPWKVETIWCIVCKNTNTGKIIKFHPKMETSDPKCHKEFQDDFTSFYQKQEKIGTTWIAHNGLGYDGPVLNNLFDTNFGPHNMLDTTVLSRLFRPTAPQEDKLKSLYIKKLDTRVGGHSLGSWGTRLNFPKYDFNEFDRFSFEMLDYCVQDVELNERVFNELMREKEIYDFPEEPIELEHKVAHILYEQKMNGFTLHKERAEKLMFDASKLIEEYKNELYKIFPQKKKLAEVYTPKLKKDGTLGKPQKKKLLSFIHEEVKPGVFNLYEMQVFNPDSPAQVAERLLDLGWKPRKFTDKGQPSTSKENIGEAIEQLSTQYPEVEVLRKYNIVTHRYQIARDWLVCAEEDGKIHGSCFHIGPWTHRSSHREPNMGNVPKVRLDDKGVPIKGVEGDFGWDARHCLTPRKGWKLVGCDASGIQLRALAHYMSDPDYIKEVCEGDVHTRNAIAAGIFRSDEPDVPDRPRAKTFIYAWLLGAGDEKIGVITTPSLTKEYQEKLFKKALDIKRWNPYAKKIKEKQNLFWYLIGRLRSEERPIDKDVVARILHGFFTKQKFLEELPALKRLKEQDIVEAAANDYMVSLDGRRIWVPNAHFAMGAYLQGFEAVVMKKAIVIAYEKLKNEGVPFGMCAYVHDEIQWETPEEHAEYVGRTFVEAIKEAGKILGSLCPLDGEYRVGHSWALTH